jgi:hypothetical protein
MHETLPKLEGCILLNGGWVNDLELQQYVYCKKWLTLLAVRLGVVLVFPHPEAICVSLRRFIHVLSAALGLFDSLG